MISGWLQIKNSEKIVKNIVEGNFYEQAVLESRKYVISTSGSYGELPKTGRATKYYYRCMGWNDMYQSGDVVHFR